MKLPAIPHPPSTLFAHGLWGIVGLFMTGLPVAWGQLVPLTDSRMPGQSSPQTGVPSAGDSAGPPRPLIAYHRDQKNTLPNPEMETSEHLTQSRFNADNSRRLRPSAGISSSPPSGIQLNDQALSNNRQASGLVKSFPTMDALRTAGTGLGIALGLLLLCAWLFRRNTPSPTTPLPKEVVSALGRAQLATRQFVQLLRVGNKLVLVSVTPEGMKPITEVTDPVEVDRLLGLCMRNHTQSTTAEFQQVLNQLSREGAKGFLGK